MTLQDVTQHLQAKARTTPSITHCIKLQRGLHLTLRYRRGYYTLAIARYGVFPSVGERAVLRRSFSIPHHRIWRTSSNEPMKGWYIHWNPDQVGPPPAPAPAKSVPTPRTPARENTNPITLRAAQRRAASVPPGKQLHIRFARTHPHPPDSHDKGEKKTNGQETM